MKYLNYLNIDMKVIVIGGGPSGMMASISASANHEVILLEKNNKLGIKLLMSGNGRCNVTNNKNDDDFINKCSKSTRFMYTSFSLFNVKDLIKFFNERGCELVEEDNNRMFPKTNKSSSILKMLENELINNNVNIKYNCEVFDWVIENNKVIGVKTSMGNIYGDYFICSCGGMSYPRTGSNGFGYELARRLGHSITRLYGAEVPLVSSDEIIQSKLLMGISFTDIKISLIVDNSHKKTIIGDMIITHFGLSGPAILELSERVRTELDKNKKVEIMISTVDDIKFDKKTLANCLEGIKPKRWVDYLVVNQNRNIDEISKKELGFIKENLTRYKFNIDNTLSIEKAIVTVGGIKTSEIDQKTMRSKFVGNVSFCGEVLDIHGPIGGYNLTLAFISGYIAGKIKLK